MSLEKQYVFIIVNIPKKKFITAPISNISDNNVPSCPIIAKGSYNTSTVIISGNDMKAINNIINKAINPDFIFEPLNIS